MSILLTALEQAEATIRERDAEIERLRRRYDDYRIAHESVFKDNERLDIEIERLRADARSYANVMLSEENDRLIAEIDRLRNALLEMIEISQRNSEASLMLLAIRKCAQHALAQKPHITIVHNDDSGPLEERLREELLVWIDHSAKQVNEIERLRAALREAPEPGHERPWVLKYGVWYEKTRTAALEKGT